MKLTEHIAAKSQRLKRLNESIDHIESLPVDEFVAAVKNLDKYVATEKIDGYNLHVGFDDLGLYTSRGGKGGDDYRTVDDYPDRPASNGFRAAHQALQKSEHILSKHIKPGELVEIEVLFGKQPNAIVYGDNMIAFLRFVEHESGNPTARLRQLSQALDGVTVTTSTTHTVTDDGQSLKNTTMEHKWKFVAPKRISNSIIASVDLSQEVAALEKFLATPSERLPNMTNGDVIKANLTKTPSDLRELVRQERERLTAEMDTNYRAPIKEKLVNQLLHKIKPSLRTTDVDDGEDFGIEGIVFLNPKTNEQFKLVDKDLFTTINKFNFAVRSAIRTTSPGKASPESLRMFGIASADDSLMDGMAEKIGVIYGIAPDLKYYTIKRTLKKYGSTPQAIIDTVVGTIEDFEGVKTQTLAAIKDSAHQLNRMLGKFRQSWSKGELRLPGGKTVKYSEEVYRRTLTTFAETADELRDLYQGVKQAENAKHLVAVVFGNQIR